MTDTITLPREVIERAISALQGCYDVDSYPNDGSTQQDASLNELLAALERQMVEEPQAPIYYMRDNHTFKKLSDDVTTALVEIETEFNAGYTYGALCSKRDGFRAVQANGENLRMFFLNACKERLESLRK